MSYPLDYFIDDPDVECYAGIDGGCGACGKCDPEWWENLRPLTVYADLGAGRKLYRAESTDLFIDGSATVRFVPVVVQHGEQHHE